MASHLSRYQYKDPAQIDMSLAGKVLTLKQEKYDAARAQIQATIDQYVGMQLLKDVDEQYLGARVNEIVNYVNQAGTMDLADGSVAQTLSNYIGSAIDDNVINAINSKKAREKQLAVFEQAKKDGTYNVMNAKISELNWESYMADENPGAVYVPQAYQPYFDYNKEIWDNIDKIQKFEDVYVDFSDGPHPLIKDKKTMQVVTPEKAEMIIKNIVGEKGLMQMSIESKYKSLNKTAKEVDDEFKAHFDQKIALNNERIKSLEVLRGGLTNDELEQLEDKIKQIEAANKQILQKYTNFTGGKDEKARIIYTDNFFKDAGQTFSYQKVKDRAFDDTFFNLWKTQEELKLKERQIQLDELKAIAEGKLVKDANGNLVPGSGSSIGPDPFDVFAPGDVPMTDEELNASLIVAANRYSEDLNTAVGIYMKNNPNVSIEEAEKAIQNFSDTYSIVNFKEHGINEELANRLINGNINAKKMYKPIQETIQSVGKLLEEFINNGDTNNLIGVKEVVGNKKWEKLEQEEKEKAVMYAAYFGKEDFDNDINQMLDLTARFLMKKFGVSEQSLKEMQKGHSEKLTNERLKDTLVGDTFVQDFFGFLGKTEDKLENLFTSNRTLGDIDFTNLPGYSGAASRLREAGLPTNSQYLKNEINKMRSHQKSVSYDPNNDGTATGTKHKLVTHLNTTLAARISELDNASEDGLQLNKNVTPNIFYDHNTGVFTARVSVIKTNVKDNPTEMVTVTIPRDDMTPELERYYNTAMGNYTFSIENEDMVEFKTGKVSLFKTPEERDNHIGKTSTYVGAMDPTEFGYTVEDAKSRLTIPSNFTDEAKDKIEELIKKQYSFKITSGKKLGQKIKGAEGMVLTEETGTGFIKPLPGVTSTQRYFSVNNQRTGTELILYYIQEVIEKMKADPNNYTQNGR